jgi:hypothetical protein
MIEGAKRMKYTHEFSLSSSLAIIEGTKGMKLIQMLAGELLNLLIR